MKKLRNAKGLCIIAAFVPAMLLVTGCSASAERGKEARQQSLQRQIDAIPEDNGINYIGDRWTGMCYGVNRFHTYWNTTTTIARVPCTPEILASIPNPEDRPGYKPQNLPAPSVDP
jgi:hypothetical protein